MTDGTKQISQVEELAERIQGRILAGEVPSGAWLRQRQLAEEFGVSRTPIREALSSLQAQGLVEVLPHRGVLVCGPTAHDIVEAYAVRAELEGYAAELAAEFGRDDQVERLREAENMFRSAAEGEPQTPEAKSGRPRWSDANDLFHEAVLEAAGNRRLANTVRSLHDSFPRNVTWSALSGSRHLLRKNAEQHREILAAIESRDPKAAREAMADHVHRSCDLIVRRFEALQT